MMAYCDCDHDTKRCRICGVEDPFCGSRRPCPAIPPPAPPEPEPMGLGDMVAAGLEAIGITKARVSAALGVKDCGCSKRQSALNALGRKLGIGVTRSDESSAPPAGES